MELIHEIAKTILDSKPDPVVRYLLLRDVLRLPLDDSELLDSKSHLTENKWIQQLQEEQWDDGSWGRFHSQDTKRKQIIPTTEYAIRRACQLGLDLDNPMLQKARDYCVGILLDEYETRDQKEFIRFGTELWDTGIKKIVAATLSEIQPDHPVLDEYRNFWISIMIRSYPDGYYNREAEIEAHSELRKIIVTNSFKRAHIDRGGFQIVDRYSVRLLGTQSDLIPETVEKAYFLKLWNEGVGYMTIGYPQEQLQSLRFADWISKVTLLSDFPSWKKNIKSQIEWLWQQNHENGIWITESGFWDFDSKNTGTGKTYLSSSWRKKENRAFDWTTRILVLLCKYYEI